MEEHVIVAARIAAMAGQDDALSGIAAYTEDGALSAIGLTPAMGTDLVVQILRLAYEAGLPPAQPLGAEAELECIACHRIDLIGSADSSMAAMVLRIGKESLHDLLLRRQELLHRRRVCLHHELQLLLALDDRALHPFVPLVSKRGTHATLDEIAVAWQFAEEAHGCS